MNRIEHRLSRVGFPGIAGVALGALLGGDIARADEPRATVGRVRPSVTVEVLDDARHVDDIISKLRKQEAGKSVPTRAEDERARVDPRREEVRRDAAGASRTEAPRNENRAAPGEARPQAADKRAIDRPALPNFRGDTPAAVDRQHTDTRTNRRTDTRDLRTERRDLHRSRK